MNIRLNHSLPEDQIIWVGNKKGEFNVKSAYYIAVRVLETMEEGESSSGDARSPLIFHRISGLNASTSVDCGWWRKAYKTNTNSERRSE